MMAFIIEFCFISNYNDIKRFNDNIDKIALIVANAILRYCNIATIPEKTSTPAASQSANVLYRVMCGSFSNRDNAKKRISELKAKGFESTIMIYEK